MMRWKVLCLGLTAGLVGGLGCDGSGVSVTVEGSDTVAGVDAVVDVPTQQVDEGTPPTDEGMADTGGPGDGGMPDVFVPSDEGPLDLGPAPEIVPQDQERFVEIKTGLPKEFVLKGVWVGDGTMIAVGNNGVVVRLDDQGKWRIQDEQEGVELLNAIHGLSSDSLWAVGKDGTLLTSDGDNLGPPTECASNEDCEDADGCTTNTCVDGQCAAVGTGGEGCCGTTVHYSGFDDTTLQGWTVSETLGPLTWQPFGYTDPASMVPRFTSPPLALYFGDPNKSPPTFDAGVQVGATITSPEIQLPPTGTATLRFQLFMDAETATTYDQLIVEVQQPDSGVVWQVWSKEDLGGTLPNFFPEQQVAVLDQWVGQKIKLRFRFDSVDSSANLGEGIYIDDIQVNTECLGLGDGQSRFETLWGTHSLTRDEGYAVGKGGTILRYNGNNWRQLMGPGAGQVNWRGMAGAGENFVLVGTAGNILVGTQGESTFAEPPLLRDLNDVSTVDGSKYWAVGLGGAVVSGAGEVWAAETVPTNEDLWGVFARANDDVWVVGAAGTVLHWDGAAWATVDTATAAELHAVWVSPAGVVTVSGENGETLRGNAGGLTLVAPLSPNWTINAAWGFGEDLVHTVGEGGYTFRYLGSNWQQDVPPASGNMRDVWGAAPNDVWAVGYAGIILHWDGGVWTQVPSGFTGALESVWGRATDDVFAVGSLGAVLHWDGTEWSSISDVTTQNLRDVHALASNDVFAVGNAATILHFNGFGWQAQAVEEVGGEPVTDQLHGVWAAGPDDAWAVGAQGQIVHWNGSTWTSEELAYGVTMRAVWGLASDDVWAVGNEGLILHWDGADWTPWPAGSIATLYAIHGDDQGNVYVTGDIGTVLKLERPDTPPVPAD